MRFTEPKFRYQYVFFLWIPMSLSDKPEVRSMTPSPYRIIEGETPTSVCAVTDANPSTNITWKWIKTDSPNMVLYNGPNYTISNIQRGRSGSYSCTASNTVGTSEAAKVIIDVLCM